MNKERIIKIINIVLDIVIVAIIAIIFFKNYKNEPVVEEETGEKVVSKNFINFESELISKEQIIEDLSFNETYVSYDKDSKIVRLSVRITNNSEKNYKIDGFVALLYDNYDKLIDTVSSFSYTFLGANESEIIIIEDECDLTDVYRVEYKPTYTKEAL